MGEQHRLAPAAALVGNLRKCTSLNLIRGTAKPGRPPSSAVKSNVIRPKKNTRISKDLGIPTAFTATRDAESQVEANVPPIFASARNHDRLSGSFGPWTIYRQGTPSSRSLCSTLPSVEVTTTKNFLPGMLQEGRGLNTTLFHLTRSHMTQTRIKSIALKRSWSTRKTSAMATSSPTSQLTNMTCCRKEYDDRDKELNANFKFHRMQDGWRDFKAQNDSVASSLSWSRPKEVPKAEEGQFIDCDQVQRKYYD